MSLDNNYSTINKQQKIISIDDSNYGTSRIIVNIKESEYVSGVTTGSVIRFDTVANQYNLSKADFPENAEVFGIVESMNSDLSLNVVVNGSITIPSNRLVNVSGTNSGLNDIYFLSGTSYGWLQNCGPTFTGMVIKPIYQASPHGQYTGLVRNYLGYINPVLVNNAPQGVRVLSAISQDMTKALFYVPESDTLVIKSLTYRAASNVFDTAQIAQVRKSSIVIEPGLDVVDFGTTPNYEAKISNDGNDLLLFAKNTNKIYSININGSVFTLKAIVNVNLPGSPEDKLWAADDELTSMVVSTKGLNKSPSNNDCRHTSPSVSSPIKYYRRSVNNLSGFKHKWKKCHEGHAHGFIKDNQPSFNPVVNSSYSNIPGIFRTCDIKCIGKNYTLTNFALKNDQIDYNSREITIQLPRYQGIVNPSSIQANTRLIGITGNVKTTANSFIDDVFILYTAKPVRTFELQSSNINFNIHRKINNYYYEDNSYKTFYGFIPERPSLVDGVSITQFSSANNFDAETTFGPSFTPTPSNTAREVLCSRMYSTETYFTSAILYNFYNLNQKSLTVYRAPFYTEDGNTVFRYFERNPKTASIQPSPSFSGFIKKFTSMDIPEINSLTFFNLFGTQDLFFLCTPSYIIVYTYSTSTFIRINTDLDFVKANFYYNANGEFFILNNKIFKYNSTLQRFLEQQIV